MLLSPALLVSGVVQWRHGQGTPVVQHCPHLLSSPAVRVIPRFVELDGKFVYYGLNAGGILFPILVLLILLVVFIMVLISTGWVLYPVHAHCAVFLYVCFLVWVFTTSMLKPSLG